MNEFEEKGRKVTINLVKANIFSVVILAVSSIVLLIPFFFIWEDTPTENLVGSPIEWIVFFVTLFIGIVVHELLHGITWAHYAKSGWKSISFGVIWKMLAPYCHCDEPMHIQGYMMGAMMPCIILGIVPSIIAIVIGSLPLLLWGIIFIGAAAGDIWTAWLLTKEDHDSLVLDHPTEAGFYIFDKEEKE